MTTPTLDVPLPLRNAIELGECVLFIGAGIGAHLCRPDGSSLPDGAGLARDIATHFSLKTPSDDLSKVSELLHIRDLKESLEDFVRKHFADLIPDQTIQWLCSRRWRAIFTTNYDRGIERGYELLPEPPQKPIPISLTSELVPFDTRFEVPIYHIHGTIFGQKQNIVISQTDYIKFKEKRRMLFEVLKEKFATSTILYIGYSNRDPNWQLLLNEITEEFSSSKLPNSFRIAPITDPDDAEILEARGIKTIDSDLEQFVASAIAQLEPFQVDKDRLKVLEASVPPHLSTAFKKNPAPVARFISSWQHVNSVPFSEQPNSRQFFRGDKPNWSLIGAEIPFERDIEADLYEDALDFITSEAKRPTALVVLGPAGYGITTALMNLAVRLIKERVGPVYFLKAAATVLEGDVGFAIKTSGTETPCFIIDNAEDNAWQIQNTIARLRDENQVALFICGSRINEWRQQNSRFSAKEYEVDSLSEIEIDKLLCCLKNNKELNKLEPLSENHRKAVIQEKHGKELLVVMKESTEDKKFDAIIEDEFFGIDNELCRAIYLTVSCFHQHGGFIRTNLLSEINKLSLDEFYQLTSGRLDGVILDECIDEASGMYAYRTRHRTIAQIIWERCGERALKDDLLQKSLGKLNLNHRADVGVFEKLIRNDWLIDNIRGLEGKIKFFDLACKKDPESPYVRQHYARMFYRAAQLDLALTQVEQGIALNKKNPPRVLIHTKGLVLSAIALEAESLDLGRRRLVQAEETLRNAMQQNQRDSYAYQALAKLYLGWAKKTDDESESSIYLQKAEEAIGEGLRNCRDKDRLWIVSAEVEQWLGDQPSQLTALETAVKESPGSIIARYILARTYRQLGRYGDAIDTLEPNIRNHQDEFRSFIEYALSMLANGKSYREAIAVLEIPSVVGLSDSRYITHLGGMNFMNGDISSAERVFSETKRRGLPLEDIHKVFFCPNNSDTGKTFELTGKVIVRKSTYSLIENPAYPPFFCHSSKYRGLTLAEGMELLFNVGFSPRGAVALNLHKI